MSLFFVTESATYCNDWGFSTIDGDAFTSATATNIDVGSGEHEFSHLIKLNSKLSLTFLQEDFSIERFTIEDYENDISGTIITRFLYDNYPSTLTFSCRSSNLRSGNRPMIYMLKTNTSVAVDWCLCKRETGLSVCPYDDNTNDDDEDKDEDDEGLMSLSFIGCVRKAVLSMLDHHLIKKGWESHSSLGTGDESASVEGSYARPLCIPASSTSTENNNDDNNNEETNKENTTVVAGAQKSTNQLLQVIKFENFVATPPPEGGDSEGFIFFLRITTFVDRVVGAAKKIEEDLPCKRIFIPFAEEVTVKQLKTLIFPLPPSTPLSHSSSSSSSSSSFSSPRLTPASSKTSSSTHQTSNSNVISDTNSALLTKSNKLKMDQGFLTFLPPSLSRFQSYFRLGFGHNISTILYKSTSKTKEPIIKKTAENENEGQDSKDLMIKQMKKDEKRNYNLPPQSVNQSTGEKGNDEHERGKRSTSSMKIGQCLKVAIIESKVLGERVVPHELLASSITEVRSLSKRHSCDIANRVVECLKECNVIESAELVGARQPSNCSIQTALALKSHSNSNDKDSRVGNSMTKQFVVPHKKARFPGQKACTDDEHAYHTQKQQENAAVSTLQTSTKPADQPTPHRPAESKTLKNKRKTDSLKIAKDEQRQTKKGKTK